MFKIMKVQTEEEYNAGLARIEELLDCEEGTPEAMELLAISDLVELYEDKHYPIGLPSVASAIEFQMEQRGLTPDDLIPWVGSRRKVAEVLSGRRDITIQMARALHKHLDISPKTLLQPPPADRQLPD